MIIIKICFAKGKAGNGLKNVAHTNIENQNKNISIIVENAWAVKEGRI